MTIGMKSWADDFRRMLSESHSPSYPSSGASPTGDRNQFGNTSSILNVMVCKSNANLHIVSIIWYYTYYFAVVRTPQMTCTYMVPHLLVYQQVDQIMVNRKWTFLELMRSQTLAPVYKTAQRYVCLCEQFLYYHIILNCTDMSIPIEMYTVWVTSYYADMFPYLTPLSHNAFSMSNHRYN